MSEQAAPILPRIFHAQVSAAGCREGVGGKLAGRLWGAQYYVTMAALGNVSGKSESPITGSW